MGLRSRVRTANPRAGGQSAHANPRPPLSRASVGTGPGRDGRRSSGPMSPVLFDIMRTAAYMSAVYQGKRWHQDGLWEEDKLVQGM